MVESVSHPPVGTRSGSNFQGQIAGTNRALGDKKQVDFGQENRVVEFSGCLLSTQPSIIDSRRDVLLVPQFYFPVFGGVNA